MGVQVPPRTPSWSVRHRHQPQVKGLRFLSFMGAARCASRLGLLVVGADEAAEDPHRLMRVTGLTRWLDQAGDLPPNVGPSVQGGSGPVTTELSSGGGLPM